MGVDRVDAHADELRVARGELVTPATELTEFGRADGG
jgi:hypothetical protein